MPKKRTKKTVHWCILLAKIAALVIVQAIGKVPHSQRQVVEQHALHTSGVIARRHHPRGEGGVLW